MLRRAQINDYEPVTRSSHQTEIINPSGFEGDLVAVIHEVQSAKIGERKLALSANSTADPGAVKTGHYFSHAALFLFTAILYARPGEFYPSPLTASIA